MRSCGVVEPAPSLVARCSIRLSTPPHEEPRLADGGDRRLPAPSHVEGHHSAEAGHLPRGDGVAGVGRQARVVHARHSRMPVERARDGERVRAVGGHAHREGAQSAQDEPRVERREDSSENVADVGRFLERLVPAAEDEDSSLHVAVPAEVLRHGMQRNVGAEVERPLQGGRRERVVHDGARPASASGFRDRRDVRDPQERIRR